MRKWHYQLQFHIISVAEKWRCLQTPEISDIYWSELTISDLRCWILLCRLSNWSCDVVATSSGPRSVGASLQRAWRVVFRCCQAMKNWRDKAKWWVGTDELTFNMLAISIRHYIHLHELIIKRYISPSCYSDKGSVTTYAEPGSRKSERDFLPWARSKDIMTIKFMHNILQAAVQENISLVNNFSRTF
jgi:hypothetical protein